MNGLLKRVVVVGIALISLVGKGENELMKYVPTGVDGVLSLQIAEIMNLPQIAEMRQENKEFAAKWTLFESELQKLGLKISDLPTEALVFFQEDRSKGGAIVKTPIDEAGFKKLLDAQQQKESKVVYQVKNIAGQKVYILQGTGLEQINNAGKNSAAVAFLRPNIAVITDSGAIGAILNQHEQAGAGDKLRHCARSLKQPGLAWVAFVSRSKPDDADGNQLSPLRNIESVAVSLNLSGEHKKDMLLDAELVCADNNAASMLAMQAQGMIMFFTAQSFQNNPQLGADISQAVSIKPDGNKIIVTINIPEKLGSDLTEYVKQLQQQRKRTAPVGTAAKTAPAANTAVPTGSSGSCPVPTK